MARKATIYMEKVGGKLGFYSKWQERVHTAWVDGLPDGQVVEMDLRRRRQAKTLPQLAYWHGPLMQCAVESLLEAGYDTLPNFEIDGEEVETTRETVDLWLKVRFKKRKNLKAVPLKRNMSVEIMGELIDFTVMWLAKDMGVVAPDPDRRTER